MKPNPPKTVTLRLDADDLHDMICRHLETLRMFPTGEYVIDARFVSERGSAVAYVNVTKAEVGR